MKDRYSQQQLPMNSNTTLKLNAYQSHLVETHHSLVNSMVESLLSLQTGHLGLTKSDLTGAGYEALISAACHFDSTRNASFKTYANKCIWHAMVAEIEQLFPSQTIVNQNGKVKEQRFIHDETINSDLTVRFCCNWEAEQAWQLETLNEAIASLNPKEQFLIRCYYGFDNKAMKLEEIANRLNVSTTAVHKRLKNTIAKLRTFIEGASSPYRMCA
jgi:RNA polymerase sigma factor (sigma-70 family)